ncbi:hypothetical protein RRG08_051044 [Elysia crispata]|uniref:Uncharacterized protein n=1 Tax=Elysia crispata TaxID=231223 RepID=A0AAE0Z5Y3_9GAST|nr:hypothetical protein RRG08_051044 [Elysia crispata]
MFSEPSPLDTGRRGREASLFTYLVRRQTPRLSEASAGWCQMRQWQPGKTTLSAPLWRNFITLRLLSLCGVDCPLDSYTAVRVPLS